MANNHVSKGDVIEMVAPADVVSGVPCKIGTLVGVPLGTGASGSKQRFSLSGHWRLVKATGAGITLGAPVYWDDTAKKMTATSSGNTLAGYCVLAAASGDTTVEMVLCRA